MHKAGLCGTEGVSNAPDASVSSPGGGGAAQAIPANEMLFLPALINKLLLMFIVIVLMLIWVFGRGLCYRCLAEGGQGDPCW